MESDSYKTVAATAQAVIKERSSKFLAIACHVENADEVKTFVDALRKEHYDATHHCYAYRLGVDNAVFRTNDDGEPSGTAGKPILGQMLSREVTDCLVVVVRWFGGTKLGIPGLIAAYRQAASDALDAAKIVERCIEEHFTVSFAYQAMNGVMKVVKELAPRIEEQSFDNISTIRLAIRKSMAENLKNRLAEVEGVKID